MVLVPDLDSLSTIITNRIYSSIFISAVLGRVHDLNLVHLELPLLLGVDVEIDRGVDLSDKPSEATVIQTDSEETTRDLPRPDLSTSRIRTPDHRLASGETHDERPPFSKPEHIPHRSQYRENRLRAIAQ